MKVSVVINTFNEEKNLPRALKSVQNWADEIVVVDMESEDNTKKIAQELGCKVYNHKRTGYVEPARNFAISKATGDWILVLDADEEIPQSLSKTLDKVVKGKFPQIDSSVRYIRIPRKNIIFNKWIRYSRWWPDYNKRFFKAGTVKWNKEIHSVPEVEGKGWDFPAKEKYALVHHHYQSISQYLIRLDRYTDQQLLILKDGQYKFGWSDLLLKPGSEFIGRFFAGQGYKDGVHGLALAALQAVSELVLYLKAWEAGGFSELEIEKDNFNTTMKKMMKELSWWLAKNEKTAGNFVSYLIWKWREKIL